MEMHVTRCFFLPSDSTKFCFGRGCVPYPTEELTALPKHPNWLGMGIYCLPILYPATMHFCCRLSKKFLHANYFLKSQFTHRLDGSWCTPKLQNVGVHF